MVLIGAERAPRTADLDSAPETRPPTHVPPPPPRPAEPVPERIPSFFDLGAEVRAELPQLELTMIRYDPDPQRRFVIMNGRRITEGLPAGRDLWVHEIRAGGVILRYIDQYFLLTPR